MPGSTPPTSQLDWLISMTAMIVLFWSRATRDLLKSFGWGIGALHRLDAATKLPFPRRPPHSISRSPREERFFANRLLPALPVGKSCRFKAAPGIGARFALVSGKCRRDALPGEDRR